VSASAPDERPAGWRVCLTTVDETTISLCVPDPGDERSPWLLAQALDLVRSGGRAERPADPGRFIAGRRRGAPLVAGETVTWAGVPLTIAAVQSIGAATGELTLHLPAWDELHLLVDEAWLWELVDDLADRLRARCGIIADGRAIGFPDLDQPQRAIQRLWRQHLGLLLPNEWRGHAAPRTQAYCELVASGLVVVLR